MSEKSSSYRQIFKATSIFGGVQFFNILISVIRSKFIAILLGPVGMGIVGLLTSTLSLLSSITGFGLGASGIKDIAAASNSLNDKMLLRTIAILNKLVWLTGGLGMVVTLILSPLLSNLTFGNYNYTWSFILLSITLLLGQLTLGKDAVLQGTRKLKWLAYANMASSVISLLITVPLYFLYGTKGIVPAIIIMSICTLIITQFYFKKLKLTITEISIRKSYTEGRPMLKLGVFLSLSGLISVGCSYGVRIFITNVGGLRNVGFYNAGFGIINTYVGLIFTAMATDYYPRLAGVINDKPKYIETVNQQGNVAFLILGPFLTVFIVFNNLIISILYSKDFLPINSMMQYAAIGVFFKSASWLMGFIILASGSTKLFFGSELISNIYMTILNCFGFYYGGLEGLGISFLVGYIIHSFQLLYISNKFYGFYFNKFLLQLFLLQTAIAIMALIIINIISNKFASYTLGSLLILISISYSGYNINKIVSLKELFSRLKKRL